uniref:DBP n=1 Tax=Cydia pomonella granulosis virus TaxID=28289 RepID=A0A6B9I696_GVCP|nr:DBP [Cydia pomonella granulovirus]QGZ00013.1 DBP [Cydia pomonella granulovirus]
MSQQLAVSTQAVPSANELTQSIANLDALEWDLQLIVRMNKNMVTPNDVFNCITSDFARNILQWNKYYRLEDLSKHIVYDAPTKSFKYDESKIQIYSIEKTDKKTQYMIGLKTMSKPKLCSFWDKATVKMCKGGFGEFHIINLNNEPTLINYVEQFMGHFMFKRQRQSEPTPLSMEDGALVSVPSGFTEKERFLSRFFVLDTNDNQKNFEENTQVEKYILNRMSAEFYHQLFEIPDKKNVSESHEFIVCTVFNGVEEKVKILKPSNESQFSFSMWYTPIVFIYVRKPGEDQ